MNQFLIQYDNKNIYIYIYVCVCLQGNNLKITTHKAFSIHLFGPFVLPHNVMANKCVLAKLLKAFDIPLIFSQLPLCFGILHNTEVQRLKKT